MSTRKSTLKAVDAVSDTGKGTFDALVSVYGVRDSQGDVIQPGAFAKSIEKWGGGENPIPVMYSHQWNDPTATIGSVTGMRETAKGLVISAQLDLDNPKGAQAYKLLKQGLIREFSVGGEESDLVREKTETGDYVTKVGNFDLWEVSLCLRGANRDTQLLSVKSDSTEPEPPEPGTEPDTHGDDTGEEAGVTQSGGQESGAGESTPYVVQLTDAQLQTLIQSIQANAQPRDLTPTVTDQPEPEQAPAITLPQIEAWAASMNLHTKTKGATMKQDELKEKLSAVKAISDNALAEGREFTTEEAEQVLKLKAEADSLKADIEKGEQAREALKAMIAENSKPEDKPVATAKSEPASTPGEAYVRTKAYTDFRSHVIPDGSPVRIAKERVAVKADPIINTSNGFGVFPTVMPGYTDLTYPRPTRFLNLITRSSTTASYVQYRQEVAVTSNAAIVPEGGLKPLSDIKTKLAEAKVWTAADGTKVTNQELADDSIIAAVINNTLIRNLNRLLEDIVLNGDGTTDGQPLGVLKTEGTQKIAFDTDMLITTNHAKEALEEIDTDIQAFVLNPADASAYELMRDKNGQFYGNGPAGVGPNTLWGIPIVKSSAIPAGTALVGDFTTVQLFNREPLTIEAFNQNEDDARHNLTYVRAEERNLLFIREPRKIAVVSLAAASKPATPAGK
ncbi:phage major capsid protein [Bifidobacterium pseudolongum subsp. globosum]|uniref:Phage major capsid protein n=1 Tax=Bifidobacterium pseudolongum subsp. globosum TaxID=1690 RepID=A0A2N3QHI7_9BIFI|nr:phage major capsid protein [Bifidobacterium pseudolongum]PKU90757.1 phage major capsid protein [Bifidobacterium pseudolongum subsp. globosum]